MPNSATDPWDTPLPIDIEVANASATLAEMQAKLDPAQGDGYEVSAVDDAARRLDALQAQAEAVRAEVADLEESKVPQALEDALRDANEPHPDGLSATESSRIVLLRRRLADLGIPPLDDVDSGLSRRRWLVAGGAALAGAAVVAVVVVTTSGHDTSTPAAATPSSSTSASNSPAIFDAKIGWIHNGPGQSEILICASLDKPISGPFVAGFASGPDGSKTGRGNAENGLLALRIPIDTLGTYDGLVVRAQSAPQVTDLGPLRSQVPVTVTAQPNICDLTALRRP